MIFKKTRKTRVVGLAEARRFASVAVLFLRVSSRLSILPGAVVLFLLADGSLIAREGAFYGALTVAGGSLDGEVVSRMNNRETFRLRQLAFLQINQADRRALQLLALSGQPKPSGRFSEGGFAFEYMLFDWLGIGKTFTVQQGRVRDVQGYQTFLRDATLATVFFFPELHSNMTPGLLELAAFSRQTRRTRPTLTGTYDVSLHAPAEHVAPFLKLSGDPFSRCIGVGTGIWIKAGPLAVTAEVFALNLILAADPGWKYYPATEYGVRFGIGVRLK